MSSPSYIFERNVELFERYYEVRKKEPQLTQKEAIMKAIKSPTTRYWVSLNEVYREILNIVHGRELSARIKSIRRKQIEDIYRNYLQLADKPTFKDCSVFFIVQFAISSQAPEFYLSFARAREIIRMIKRNYDVEEI